MIEHPPDAPPAGHTAPLSNEPASATSWRHANRSTAVAGSAFSLLTVLAIALACLAPQLTSNATANATSGLTRVYDSNLQSAASQWTASGTCTFSPQGLAVSSSAASGNGCAFAASQQQDLTSNGFYLSVTLAPANHVAAQEEGVIFVNQAPIAAFGQDGHYLICRGACDASNASQYTQGETVAWHTDGYVSNTFAVQLSAGGSTLTVYANGQQVAREQVQLAPPLSIALGAAGNTSALFTHMTLYSGSASSLSTP